MDKKQIFKVIDDVDKWVAYKGGGREDYGVDIHYSILNLKNLFAFEMDGVSSTKCGVPRLDEKAIQLKPDKNYKTGYGCDAKWVGNMLDDILSYMEDNDVEYPKVLLELKQHLRFKGNDDTSNYELWLNPKEQIVWGDEISAENSTNCVNCGHLKATHEWYQFGGKKMNTCNAKNCQCKEFISQSKEGCGRVFYINNSEKICGRMFLCDKCENQSNKDTKSVNYKCGHKSPPIILDYNELSCAGWLEWKESVGYDGDKSKCWDCWCKEQSNKDTKSECNCGGIRGEDWSHETWCEKESKCEKGCGKVIYNTHDDGDRSFDSTCGDGILCEECEKADKKEQGSGK